jgi:hypothetical protein
MSVGGEFSLPEGLSLADFRRHPIVVTIQDAAMGGRRGLPSKAELDALKLSPSLRADVAEACEHVARMHGTGEQKMAWHVGYEKAAALLARVPVAKQDPAHYAPPDPHADVTDPAELAALVPRHGLMPRG